MKFIMFCLILCSFNTYSFNNTNNLYRCKGNVEDMILEIQRIGTGSSKELNVSALIFMDRSFNSQDIESKFLRLEAFPDAAEVYEITVSKDDLTFKFQVLDAVRLEKIFIKTNQEFLSCDN